MDTAILKKENLGAFLTALNTGRLFAPVARNGRTSFEQIADPGAAALDLDNYIASPKHILFPQTECLFAFGREKDSVTMAPANDAAATVVFGIRPCDARSLVLLDPLFRGDFSDPYYIKRREQTLLIGLACREPAISCFCPSLGGSPASGEGLDMLFIDIGDTYFVKVLTMRAGVALSRCAALLTVSSKEQQAKKDQAERDSLAKIRRRIDLDGVQEKLPRIFEESIWMERANKCLGCGICTYYCPTCHCFDIQDEGDAFRGRRIRVWDSCMFAEFTRHASGVNPRATRAERLRNRVLHKFSYFPRNLGAIACVGCGRCIELCPVNEDIIDILERIKTVNE